MPQTLQSLGEGAFSDAHVKLANVADGCMIDFKDVLGGAEIKIFPALVPPGTRIVKKAQFLGQSIWHIVIPKSVREIRDFAFASCVNL